jgi:hypothetical protein
VRVRAGLPRPPAVQVRPLQVDPVVVVEPERRRPRVEDQRPIGAVTSPGE